MTEELFRTDPYLQSCTATVVTADDHGIALDRTVFYPRGGGQPGDRGYLETPDGMRIIIDDCRKDAETGEQLHIPDSQATIAATGDRVIAVIDWKRRHKLMRMHSCLHLLCAVVEGGVTGGSVGEEKSRLDFDLPDTTLDKDYITAELNRLIEEDYSIEFRTIDESELEANPELVRTMSVQPPRDQGAVRVIDIVGIDLQPCGGTHVRQTGEIGRVRVGKIENKGRHNRRINIHFDN